MDRYWKTDRISAYEAPRETAHERETRSVKLLRRGRTTESETRVIVQIPKAMKLPDIITYHGHTFVHRSDESYSEASMWPIVEELDANTR